MQNKYYGFRANAKIFDPMLSRLKKHFKRRSISDLLYFLITEADEKNLSKALPTGSKTLSNRDKK